MNKITLIILSLLFVFISCEKFPKENDLIGKWIPLEQQDTHQATFEFSDKYFIQSDACYSFLYNKDTVYYDTCLYSLDKKKGYLYLSSEQYPEATSFHEISLNKGKNELTIWGLFPSIPEEKQSKTVLKKLQ